MMKKVLLLLTLVLCFSAAPRAEEAVDLVVILDTSSSMSASFGEVSGYLTGSFLQEQLHLGDTFHLISFSALPALELSRRIEGRGDIQTIIGRLLILYPVNPDTDIVSALEFGRRYVAGLPQGRKKKVFLFSDGDHGTGSGPYAGIGSSEGRQRIQNAGAIYSPLGASFQYVPVPLSGAAQAVSRPASQPGPQSSPPGAAQAAAAQAVPQGQAPGAGSEANARPGAASGANGAAESLPPEQAGGTVQIPLDPGSGNSGGAAVETAEPGPSERAQIENTGRSGESSFSVPVPLVIGLIGGALLVLALVLLVKGRGLQRSPNRAMAEAASGNYREEDVQRTRESAALLANYAASQRKGGSYPPAYRKGGLDSVPPSGPLMLSLFVSDQNTAIGKRNIHTVKSGYTFSVGGGKSDFLIFLVPMPSHIADVHYDGNNCTFIPRKGRYFPDLGSSPLHNCIGENIRVISDKNYELHIRIERYQDPLITLNRMLHSIELPGLPEF